MRKFLYVAFGLMLMSAPGFAEDDPYETCMKNSPYASKDVADKECRGISERVLTIPERFAIEDRYLAIHNEIARQNFLDAEAALILQHRFHHHNH